MWKCGLEFVQLHRRQWRTEDQWIPDVDVNDGQAMFINTGDHWVEESSDIKLCKTSFNNWEMLEATSHSTGLSQGGQRQQAAKTKSQEQGQHVWVRRCQKDFSFVFIAYCRKEETVWHHCRDALLLLFCTFPFLNFLLSLSIYNHVLNIQRIHLSPALHLHTEET